MKRRLSARTRHTGSFAHGRARRGWKTLLGAAATVLVAGALTGTVSPLAEAHPATQGQLLYTGPQSQPVYTVNPDGTGTREVYPLPMECAHWSPDGGQIASCGAPAPDGSEGDGTTILDVDTGATRFLPFFDDLFSPCFVWSPDGRRLACETSSDSDPSLNGIRTIRVRDWSHVRRVTYTPAGGDDVPGSYSADGHQMVFLRTDSDGTSGLFVVRLDGKGLRQLSPAAIEPRSTGDWSPRGNVIVFSGREQPGHRQVMWTVHPDGSGLQRIVVEGVDCGGALDEPTSVGCSAPVWSPDGTRIAFRLNAVDRTGLLTSTPTGTDLQTVVPDVGLDPGDPDWGTHPLAGQPSDNS